MRSRGKVFVRFGGGTFCNAPSDSNLLILFVPVKDESGSGIAGELLSFAASVVREEMKTPLVDTL